MNTVGEWDADTPCSGCGHTASAHLGGDVGGECLRRPGGRFCPCVAYWPGGGLSEAEEHRASVSLNPSPDERKVAV